MNNYLLPCPCCGGTNVKRYVPYGVKSVHCKDCHVSLRECDWCRRYTPLGYKLVPIIAPISVQNELKLGDDKYCSYQEWWDAIINAVGEPNEKLMKAAIEYKNKVNSTKD